MTAPATAEAPMTTPANAAVWFEIPVTDMEKAKAFYGAVLMTALSDQNDGPNPMAVFAYGGGENAVSGHLYPGKPATDGNGITVHLAAIDNVEAAMGRVEAAGGKVVSPIIDIPAGRFVYCRDPDGNSIGIFSQ